MDGDWGFIVGDQNMVLKVKEGSFDVMAIDINF